MENLTAKKIIVTFLILLTLGLAGNYYAGRDQRYAVEHLADKLKDAESAKFRNLKSHGGALCGDVNSKNSYGAYTGFSRFIIIKRTPSIYSTYIDDGDGRFFDFVWEHECGN